MAVANARVNELVALQAEMLPVARGVSPRGNGPTATIVASRRRSASGPGRAGPGPLLQEVQRNEIEVCSGRGSAEPEMGPG